MTLKFDKYHGCGNDFIMIDNLDGHYDGKLDTNLINTLCNRRYGIGADGLILLSRSDSEDFKMIYYNADGNESTMCGNGGRCIVAFAKALGVIKGKCTFDAIDGQHYAEISNDGIVNLIMSDVEGIAALADDFVLDTGSPHYIRMVEDIEQFDVFVEGRSIRNSEAFAKDGINVNFVEKVGEDYRIRTYERGVEAETDACGTGVTAAALVLSGYYNAGTSINLQTNGGLLTVEIGKKDGDTFEDISLIGPAVKVYTGSVEISFLTESSPSIL